MTDTDLNDKISAYYRSSNYGELIKSSSGTQEFLERALAEFASNYKCEKTSLYVFDNNTRQLTQKAATGFPMFPKATLVMNLGEGLAGRVLAEKRPIYTEMASQLRGYIKYHNFPIDDCQTFLGIPLLRGKLRIGAIALFRRTGVPFLAEEISAAKQQAEKFSSAIQSAGALLTIENAKSDAEKGKKTLNISEELTFGGSSISNGWGIGLSHIFSRKYSQLSVDSFKFATTNTIRSIEEAIDLVENKLKESTEALSQRLPEAASMIFESSSMIMRDENFLGKIKKLQAEGKNVIDAVTEVSLNFINLFESSTENYIQEKARDVEDLALQLIEALTEHSPQYRKLTNPHIIIAEKLFPSDILRIAQGNVKGIALLAGGATSHVALLVRSLHIPTIVIKNLDLMRIPDNETVIIDCANDFLYVHPTNERLEKFEQRRIAQINTDLNVETISETKTIDDVTISLNANINLISDIDTANKAKADGIGLYRTEFPFIMRQTLPTEKEQQDIYIKLIQHNHGKPVVFRTLDAGGDKILPYLFKTKEENPALGLRSMRFTLRYPTILDQQLRAMIRAIQITQADNISIMFPMISTTEEMLQAEEHFWNCLESIHAEIGDKELIVPKIGVMIEIPAAISILDELAEISDFFSIGTNDLIQYTLGVDRTNDYVSHYYLPHHPAILNALKQIADSGIKNNIPVSVCGEMGRDPKYIPFLIGIGIHSFSLEPQKIPHTRELISRFTSQQCEQYAQELLSLRKISEIENKIDEFTEHIFDN